jgi:hypothetical protein
MENKTQYEKNLQEIRDFVKMLDEKNNELSLESKYKFSKKVRQDKELLEILLEKKDMRVEVQERFLSYLRELLDITTTNA